MKFSVLEWRVGGILLYSLVVQLEFIMRKPTCQIQILK
jgi:hypothetical protein